MTNTVRHIVPPGSAASPLRSAPYQRLNIQTRARTQTQTHNLYSNGPWMVRTWSVTDSFLKFLAPLPNQDQLEKAKYAPQIGHVRCPPSNILPPGSLCQQPPIRAYLKPFVHPRAFLLSCLPLGLCQMQGMVADSLSVTSSELLVNRLHLFSFGWSLFIPFNCP